MHGDMDHLRARVEALPGVDLLLPALDGLAPAYLVGGAVRDLLLGAPSVDLDVAVEGDGVTFAREVAARLGGEVEDHDRFGTATVRAGALSVDVATTRRERYRAPGALPEVEPASLADDLARRDFTINAMAISLAEAARGHLHDPYEGRRDLASQVVRVLHRRSFVDDPTRVLRAIRYEARLRFRMDRDTEALARAAVTDGALGTVSATRISGELMLLLSEDDVRAGLERLSDLGVDVALDAALRLEPESAPASAAHAPAVGADRALAALAAIVARAPDALRGFIERLALTSGARDRVLRAARSGPAIADALSGGRARSPSQLHELMSGEPAEALALALAHGAPREPIERFRTELADVRLEISGDDLVVAGVPPSPALGAALAETLRRKLDGEVSGREAELRCALELARRGAAAG